MKLWEIKAESLRLMFADTDIEFNQEDFSERTIYENANTREKLVRMEDSIRRAIDLFYQYNGELTQITQAQILVEDEIYKNIIDMSEVSNFGFPTRVDINKNLEENIVGQENISFIFDRISKRIYFNDYDFTSLEDSVSFTIYYRMAQQNIPNGVDEMTYDLDGLFIPPQVQRQIPYYVKSELYEEDEASISKQARNNYIEFLILNQRKNYSKVSTKVKKRFNWGSE